MVDLQQHLHAALLAWSLNIGPTRMAEGDCKSVRRHVTAPSRRRALRSTDRLHEQGEPSGAAPIGVDTSASAGLRHKRGRPAHGPRPAFVLRRNSTTARQETRFARQACLSGRPRPPWRRPGLRGARDPRKGGKSAVTGEMLVAPAEQVSRDRSLASRWHGPGAAGRRLNQSLPAWLPLGAEGGSLSDAAGWATYVQVVWWTRRSCRGLTLGERHLFAVKAAGWSRANCSKVRLGTPRTLDTSVVCHSASPVASRLNA